MRFGAIAVLSVMVLLAGCMTPARLKPVVHYVITPTVDVAKAESSEKSLGVRALEPARPYKEKVVCREPGHGLVFAPGVQWAEFPSDSVTRVLSDALTATGRFRDVGDTGDIASPDFVLTGYLRKFDLVREQEPWVAECEIRLELRKTLGSDLVWEATLSAREPLATNDLTALPGAMSKAVSKVVKDAVAGITAK